MVDNIALLQGTTLGYEFNAGIKCGYEYAGAPRSDNMPCIFGIYNQEIKGWVMENGYRCWAYLMHGY